MKLNTTSEVISFAKRLEEDGVKLYEDMAQRYISDREAWLSFVTENRKNIVQIERAYYGVITDAIEGCFAFNMNPDEYTLKIELAENTSYSDALDKAVEIEEKMIKFYSDAAEQSKSLMADIPRTFTMIAQKRNGRSSKLRSLLSKEG
jgi:rubrerythrin